MPPDCKVTWLMHRDMIKVKKECYKMIKWINIYYLFV